MGAQPEVESGIREALIAALGNQLRGRVITVLSERPDVTIRQVAERLGESPRRVRHQIDALVGAGLAAVTSESRRRGVVERRYAARVRVEIEDAREEDRAAQANLSREVVRLLLTDVSAAAAAGTFGSGQDDCVVRFYGEVDDACREELYEIHARAYREIDDAIAAGRERLRASGEPGTEVVSALFYFKAPLWDRRTEGLDGP